MSHRSRIAVVVPCRNEERAIRACLVSMLQNDYPQELIEIIVVDGQSTDRTREVVDEYSQRFPLIRCISNPQRTTPYAINIGVRAARNPDYIMLASAHCIYAPDYFSSLVRSSREHQADLVGGFRANHIPDGLWSSTLSRAVGHRFAGGDAAYRTDARRDRVLNVETVFGGCYRRDVFERFGFFNESLVRAQDREFNTRISRNGGRVIYDPSIRCTYFARGGLRDYARWTVRGAYWLFHGHLTTGTRMLSRRNFAPALFFLYQLALIGCLLFAPTALAIVATSPLLLYIAFTSYYSAQAAIEFRRPGYLFTYPLTFAVTHYGYAVGSFWGCLTGCAARARQNTRHASAPRSPAVSAGLSAQSSEGPANRAIYSDPTERSKAA